MAIRSRRLWFAFTLLAFGSNARADDPADDGPPAYVEKGDLPALQKRGVLRALFQGGEERSLSRAGDASPAEEADLLEAFAKRHKVELQIIRVAEFDQLIPMLNDGQGDVIVDNLTVTEARQKLVGFTSPIGIVSEILVGKKGASNPHALPELAGRDVHVGADSSYAESLAKLKTAKGIQFNIVTTPASMDPESIADDVAGGKRPLTVLDSTMLPGLQAYDDQIEQLFPIAEGRRIAWAVRKSSTALKAALDAFVLEHALTERQNERMTGDLDALRKRGSIRVLTRNNALSYFLHRGERFGFDYELTRLAAKELGLRLEMVVVPSHDALIPWLLEGRGDVIAASYSDTPERKKQVAFSVPYLDVDQVLVGRAAGPRVKTLAELKGKKIAVRMSSSYAVTLAALQEKYGPFKVLPLAENVETEQALDQVAKGKFDFTVADSHIFKTEQAFQHGLKQQLLLPGADGSAGQHGIRFAVRPANTALLAALDAFVKKARNGLEYNMARRRYFEDKQTIVAGMTESAKPGQLSPYDKIIKKLAKDRGLDWRLMAAQAYQESRFDPNAKSWVGAVGLFQVMPATGAELGIHNLHSPELGAKAGITYLSKLMNRIDPSIPFRHRVRFALAAYNCGLGHVQDAQRLAEDLHLDPHRWFGNVEKAMLLLEEPQYAAHARHGYCRGSEPVKYVSEIQNRYDNYVKVIPE